MLSTIVNKLPARANNQLPENTAEPATVTRLQRSADYYGKNLQLWEALGTIKALNACS